MIFSCYDSNYFVHFCCSVDDGFPKITFHFEDDLALNVYPHDYFFQNGVTLHLTPGVLGKIELRFCPPTVIALSCYNLQC